MEKIRQQLKTIRFEFSSEILDESTISKSPFIQFGRWMQDALNAGVNEPNAMTIASVNKKGEPDARIVLLRDFSSKGFSFFTNYDSIKGREIRQNKNVCLNFFWPEVHRQVRIKGSASKISPKISDSYFSSRPRESQIAALASYQSEKLVSRSELDKRFKEIEKKFEGKKIKRPEHWGGFLIRPSYFEFWQGQTNRLHDRICYEFKKGKWKVDRLNP